MRRLLVAFLVGVLLSVAGRASAQDYRASDEDRVRAMVNATRAQRGLQSLAHHEGLVTLARRQSVRMVQQNRLFHNPGLGAELDALSLDWAWSGENVGVGPDVVAVENAFLASPHHLENIVRPNYTAMGVGVVATGGYVYVTQVFAEVKGAAKPVTPQAGRLPATPNAPPPATAPPPTAPPSPQRTEPPMPVHVAVEGGIVAPGPPFDLAEASRIGPHGALAGFVGGILEL